MVSNKDNTTLEALRVIPYPEPGRWYLGLRVECVNRRQGRIEPCPGALRAAMVSVNLHIQPCGYRPSAEVCGDHGVCAKATKGQFR